MRHLEGQLEEKNQELQRVCIFTWTVPLKHQHTELYSTYKEFLSFLMSGYILNHIDMPCAFQKKVSANLIKTEIKLSLIFKAIKI